jgi:MFS family permease
MSFPLHSCDSLPDVVLYCRWAGGAIFGRIIDTYGVKHIAIVCTIACTFFVAMLSLSTEFYQIFLTQGVGFGLSASGLFSCGIVSVGQFFYKRKALALGIVLAGSSTGILPFKFVNH